MAPYERPALSKAYLFPEGKQFICYLLNAILDMSFSYLGFPHSLIFSESKIKEVLVSSIADIATNLATLGVSLGIANPCFGIVISAKQVKKNMNSLIWFQFQPKP